MAGRALLYPGLLQCEGGKTEVQVLLSVLQAKCWFEKPKIQGRLSGKYLLLPSGVRLPSSPKFVNRQDFL